MKPNAQPSRRRILLLAPAFLLISSLTFANRATASESGEKRIISGLTVNVWAPPGEAKAPVVIFSHGFHGCATQSSFLMEAMANAGYLVVAPNHSDATCNGGTSKWMSRGEAPFGKPDQWTPATYQGRRDDLRKVMEQLRTDSQLSKRADLTRLALCGHSLGGYTALSMGGARPEWKLEGVRAVLALSPYAQPLIDGHLLLGINAPIMYQGGTRDRGITPYVKKPGGAYAQSKAPKYFIEFEGAGHFAWTDKQKDAHAAIIQSSLAFLNHYIKGASGESLTKSGTGVSTLWFQSALGTSEGQSAAGERDETGDAESTTEERKPTRGGFRERIRKRLEERRSKRSHSETE